MDYLTNDEELNGVLEKQVAGLPPELRAVIESDAIEVFARKMAEHFALTEVEEEALVHEIALVVMKIEAVDSLLGHLLAEAVIPLERAQPIVEEAKKTLFVPFSNLLIQNEAGASVPPVPPALDALVEKPYVETPVKKAAYGAILDVPNYTAMPSAPSPKTAPAPVPFIPETPAIRVQPSFEAPTTSPRPPGKLLPTENIPTPPQAQ